MVQSHLQKEKNVEEKNLKELHAKRPETQWDELHKIYIL